MKVKNIFSNRRTKKKKNSSQANSSVTEVGGANHSEKLIIPTADNKDGNTSGKDNSPSDVTGCTNYTESSSTAKVVLRRNVKKTAKCSDHGDFDDPTKLRASSTSSAGSSKGRARRPWSFIEQMRRQDSRESAYSTGSSVRTSQLVDDLMSGTPPPHYDDAVLVPKDSPRHDESRLGALTLPRSLTPERFEQESKAIAKRDSSSKRRTMDFRFFHFFKRSSESPLHSDSGSPSVSLLGGTSRSSLRGKSKGKKKQATKKKDLTESHSNASDGVEDPRSRSFSDGTLSPSSPTIKLEDEASFQAPPPGLYDSEPRLNTLTECPEPTPEKSLDKRVPENGESASDFVIGSSERHSSASLKVNLKSSRKYERRSDPTNCHNLLRMQMSEGSMVEPMARSSSYSANAPSSRRSSAVCEPMNFPLPEDSVATFDGLTHAGPSYRKLHSAGSVPHLPITVQNQKLQRAFSNDIPKESLVIADQTRCSQSVTDLVREIPDVDKRSLVNGRVPKTMTQLKHDASGDANINPPPSPVLRAIGIPGVVLRDKKNNRKQRPSSEQRSQLVMSLNVEDLPTYYAQMRFDQTRVGGYPSCEDILKESRSSSKMGSSGARYSSSAGARARRRGATLSTHGITRSGFTNAASVEDLDSLSSSNFGSKQSLSDLSQLDQDELLNALLAKKNALSHTTSGNARLQEPSLKKAKAIRKSVVSLANLISPGKPNQKGKLQRSSSFKESGSSAPASNSAAAYSFKPYRPPSNTPNKKKNNRRSKLWCETFDHNGIGEGEIKRQEAIFELFQGERDLVQDLTMAKQTYRDSMVTLKMLSDEEVALIFGKLGCLLPLHEELLAKLEQARGEDGRTLAIGYIFVEWFPRISTAYRDYCANQSDAKYALDAAVERDDRVRDFLQRCLESPFSRKLDLWSYLDLPRTRLVKYPLLLQNVLKRTPEHLENERRDLSKVMDIIGKIIEKVDETTGEQQCCYIRSKLEYLDDKQKSHFVDNSRMMLCSGQLKNNRGTKMHVFLFEEALVLTRQTTRSNKVSYQVYRNPLPLRSLTVDANEGVKLSGSFKGGILSSEKVKHSFRVRSEEFNVTYTLQASEEHDRKQWINAIQDALCKYRAKNPELVMSIENHIPISKRRATYDPSSKKPRNARVVNRSSSDKSNTSVASSTDKSSIQDESPEDDVSTTSEEIAPWGRNRSQTVDLPNLQSQSSSSVSRQSSGSSTKSDKSSSITKKVEKTQGSLRRTDPEKEGSSLRSSLRRKSLVRHFSLGKGDRASKTALAASGDHVEKERNKCQRSRSLSASPQTAKSLTSRFGHKRLSNASNAAVAPSAAKPPIGPSSPYILRRAPKPASNLLEAQSTPNLACLTPSTSLDPLRTRASTLMVSQNISNSVGNLRVGLTESGASDVISNREMMAEDAKLLRKTRSHDKPSSESEIPDVPADMEISVTFHVGGNEDEQCDAASIDILMNDTDDTLTPGLPSTPEEVEVESDSHTQRDSTDDQIAEEVVAEFSSHSEVRNSDALETSNNSETSDLISFDNGNRCTDEKDVLPEDSSERDDVENEPNAPENLVHQQPYPDENPDSVSPLETLLTDADSIISERECANEQSDFSPQDECEKAEGDGDDTVRDSENDSQKSCRSEMLEESISAPSNMQTAT